MNGTMYCIMTNMLSTKTDASYSKLAVDELSWQQLHWSTHHGEKAEKNG